MFTVCPKCALTLAVTAADLRVAQGYVRCGRCLNVFNALARLSEERPVPAAPPPPDTVAAGAQEPAEAAPPSAAASTFDDTGEIELELDASVLRSTRVPPAETTAQTEAPIEEPRHARLQQEDRTAPADSRTSPPASSPPVAVDAEAAPPSAAAASSVLPAEPAPLEPVPPLESPDPSPRDASADAPQTNSAQQQLERAFDLNARRPRAPIAWQIGAGALTIALALQIVNHYRDALAAHSALSGPLSAVYSALGVKIAPQWNIHAYEVRQLGASVAGATAGEIVVRASVKNSGARAQPLPLLRVTLQDRFGNRIAARDVPPGDYLLSPVAPGALLAAGSRVDATMTFVDPGPQAVGFEIDACLRQSNGEVACAHGP